MPNNPKATQQHIENKIFTIRDEHK